MQWNGRTSNTKKKKTNHQYISTIKQDRGNKSPTLSKTGKTEFHELLIQVTFLAQKSII